MYSSASREPCDLSHDAVKVQYPITSGAEIGICSGRSVRKSLRFQESSNVDVVLASSAVPGGWRVADSLAGHGVPEKTATHALPA